jgi:beta-lactamase regulating signal transducer with metallopeptidase domain
MNPEHGDIASTLIEPWGRQLLHASWQGALLIAIIAIVCRALPRLPAGARCILWWLACLKLLIGLVWLTPVGVPLLSAPRRNEAPPTATSATRATAGQDRHMQGVHDVRPARAGGSAAPSVAGAMRKGNAGAFAGAVQRTSAPSTALTARLPLLTILLSVWLSGGLLRLIIALIPLRRVQHLLATATVVNDPDIQLLMSEIATDMRLSQAPCLLLSEVETEPLAVSHWQNIVLLSHADFERLNRDELRAVLAHEFAHIRRADLWMGLIPFATQIVFWFHPFAWLACYEFAISREAACDAAALHAGKTPTRTYSELLLKLGTRHTPLGPAIALGATSQFRILQRRIIMMHQTPRCSRRLLIAGLTALFVSVIGLGMVPWRIVAAQDAPEPANKPDAPRSATEQQKGAAQSEESNKLPTVPINMDFADGMKGWHFSSHDGEQNYFDSGIDSDMRYQGTPSPFLYSSANLPRIYGVVTQWIDATPYRGKRICFSAYIKTQGVKEYAGPMFGLVGGEHERTYLMQNQPIKGDTDWKRYSFVTDIDTDVKQFVLGMNLQGKGKVWMNHLALEEVGKDVPVSPHTLIYRPARSEARQRPTLPKQPSNMDFAHGLQGWNEVEEGDENTPVAYRTGLDRRQAQRGVTPAYLTSDGSQPNGYGTMVQYIDPVGYLGKRIRLTGVIKTQGVNKYAGLWVGMSGSEWVVWDAEHSTIKAPTDWTTVSLVMEVPKDSTSLGLGVMIRGVGKLWVKNLKLEAVGADVPVSPITLHMDGN